MNSSIPMITAAVFFASSILASCATTAVSSVSLTDEVRKELLDARETAWRSFFLKDTTAVEEILGHELIAIQQSAEAWEDRTSLVLLAKKMGKRGVRVLRLEFPRTEIQLFGDTAILYYTYVFETGLDGRTAVDAGRGTEIFVRRGGKWVDVGWHLDQGAFLKKDDTWVRIESPPDASSTGS